MESRASSLVSTKSVFGQENSEYSLEIESGILNEGDYVWETFRSNHISLSCNLSEDFKRLANSDYTGKGAMILSPYESFFILIDKNNYYGISMKLSDNTLKINKLYPVLNKKGFFRSKVKEKIFAIADLEYVDKNSKCVSNLIKNFYGN